MNQTKKAGAAASHTNPEIENLDDFIKQTKPRYPVAVLRPDVLEARAAEFKGLFPGRILYAVKCNPDPDVLKSLIAGGLDSFDCASIGEVKLVRGLKPDATIYFMHPIKARESIREAYFDHGIRAFVLDTADEFRKILEETKNAKDLTLFVRMAVPKQKVATDFSVKFGAPPVLATELLAMVRPHAKQLGLSFHVGTHCLDLGAYKKAVKVAAQVIKASGVEVEALDVGGGFPAVLDPFNPPAPISEYIETITNAVKAEKLNNMELLCEPGRGMVAMGGQLVVRVELRKGDLLYLNDGCYGGMFEGGPAVGLPYPSYMVRADGPKASPMLTAFRFAGPTCDSVDMMKGPYLLPEDIDEGDYIVLDQLGAYGEVSRTGFNGFDQVIKVDLIEKKTAVKPKAKKAA